MVDEDRKMIDPARFREVLGHHPTGVSVVTGFDAGGEPVGMVVGSFASVSLDPPLVSFMPMKDSGAFARLRTAPRFSVNVLAADQERECRILAGRDPDRFSRVSWSTSPAGGPVLDGVLAVIDCEWRDDIDAGDHWIILGSVIALEVRRSAPALIFFQGGYGRWGTLAAPAFPDRALIAGTRLAAAALPRMRDLAERFGIEVTAYAPLGDALSIVETVVGGGREPLAEVGTRIPLIPPFGEQLVAHSGRDVVERWLARLPSAPPGQPDSSASHRRRLAEAARRGWSATNVEVDMLEIERAAAMYSDREPVPAGLRAIREIMLAADGRYRPIDLTRGRRSGVGTLSSAVLLPSGEVGLVLQCSQLDSDATTDRVREWIDALTSLTAELARDLSGECVGTLSRRE